MITEEDNIRFAWRAGLALGFLWGFLIGAVLIAWLSVAHAREGDDHGNHGDLKGWFDQLKSHKGMCCSFADGISVQDVDWDTAKDASGNEIYRVRLADRWMIDNGNPAGNLPGAVGHYIPEPGSSYSWVVVPKDALITEANKFGSAVVWPEIYAGRVTGIRCFIPGAGA